jgi:hypothetical protein
MQIIRDLTKKILNSAENGGGGEDETYIIYYF